MKASRDYLWRTSLETELAAVDAGPGTDFDDVVSLGIRCRLCSAVMIEAEFVKANEASVSSGG